MTDRIRNLEPLLKGSNKDFSKGSGWTCPLIFAGFSMCIGLSLPVGYSIGNINTPSNILTVWCNQSVSDHYNISLSEQQLTVLWSTVVSIYLIGGMIGSLSGSFVADRLGRKGAVLTSVMLQTIAGIFFFSTKPLNSVELLLMARVTCGLASGLATSVVPMYLIELSPINLKGAMGVMCPLGVTFGVLVGQIVGLPFVLGTDDLWHYLLSAYTVLVFISAITLPWLPESPKYLYVIKRDRQAALKVLTILRNMPPAYVVGELEESAIEIAGDSNSEKWTIAKLLSTPSMYLNLALVCSLQAGQQVSGINAVFYYSVSIFQSAGLSLENAQYASLGAGGINFLMAVVTIPLINNLPRRLLAITSSSLAVIFLLGLTAAMTLMKTFVWMSYLSIVAVLGYVLVYGLGMGPIPFFIGSELFDVGPRPAAMALGSVANWSGNFLVGMAFPLMQQYLKQYSFLVFAVFTSCLTTFLVFHLPETNAKVLKKREASRQQEELNLKV